MTDQVKRDWTFAIIEVGLPDEFFWQLTPREFWALCERWGDREKRDVEFKNRLTARICSIIANVNRDPKSKPQPWTESDFMPVSKAEAEAQQSQSWESQMAILGIVGVKEKH